MKMRSAREFHKMRLNPVRISRQELEEAIEDYQNSGD